MTNCIMGLIGGRAIPFFIGELKQRRREGNGNVKKAIDYFRIPHNTLRLLPQILQRLLLSNTLGKMQFFLEHLKTKNYATFVGGKHGRLENTEYDTRPSLVFCDSLDRTIWNACSVSLSFCLYFSTGRYYSGHSVIRKTMNN